MEKTIFQKIIDREIPATIVYEDTDSLAFLDIRPHSKGHTLLVPKIPYGRIQNVPEEVLGELFKKSQRILKAMISGLPCDYVQVLVIGKDVPDHFHIQLIPRMNEYEFPQQPALSYNEGEAQTYADKIKSRL
jgi:histidine triad (HIT) family protein